MTSDNKSLLESRIVNLLGVERDEKGRFVWGNIPPAVWVDEISEFTSRQLDPKRPRSVEDDDTDEW